MKRAAWEAGEHCPYLGHLLQEPGRKMSVGADHEPDAIGQFSDCSWQELRGPDLGCQPGAQAKGCLGCTSPLVGLSSKAEFPVTSVFSLKTGAFQVVSPHPDIGTVQ